MMKSLHTLLAALSISLASGAFAASPEPLTVAVFDFESKDESMREAGAKVGALLGAALSAEPDFVMVERAEIEKVMGEQELGLSGGVSQESAAKVGAIIGAKVLVTGRVIKADKELILVAKVIGTETSRVFGETVKGVAGGSLSDLCTELAKKVAAIIVKKGESFTAKVKTPEDRLASIKKAIEGRKRPSVAVNISERHFGQPVIDPAAATELGKMLLSLGFEVLDEKSKNPADVEISGEAFSAYAMRKGNLVSCRSRIEIKAHERASGKVLSIDRQMSAAVDISEQSAAKISLQNAAVELAERLIPAITK